MSSINTKTASIAELVAYYNAHSGKPPIKTFKDRPSALKRVATLQVPAKGKGSGIKRMAVTCGGKSYVSLKQAFKALKLPTNRVGRFRKKIKKADGGALSFEHGNKTFNFKIAA
jgi:hypothetical protein